MNEQHDGTGPSEKRPLHLLAVEDDRADAELMAIELKRAGFDVTMRRVETSEELADALTDEPDVVLTDYNLPRFSAHEAVRMVRERSALLPIILVSGAVSESLLADLARIGANDYFLKDRLGRLGQAVEHLLAERLKAEEMSVAKEARRRSELQYRALFQQSSDGVILSDARTGVIVEANARAAELFGMDAVEMVGLPYAALFSGSALGDVSDPCALRSDGKRTEGRICECADLRIARSDGTFADLEVTASLVEVPDSAGFVQSILRDVTERKRLEAALREERDNLERIVEVRTAAVTKANAELQEANLQLRAANALKRRFLRHMHHELKTPLSAIIGHSGLLLGQDPHEEQRRSLEQINRAGEHLLALITDMLDLTDIESGTLSFSTSNVPPQMMCEEPVGVLWDRITRKRLDVQVEIDPALGAIRGDVKRCRQIIINLLTNAIKFTPEGGRITVSAEYVAPDRAVVSVADTGVGIPESDLPYIFDEFYQADKGRDRALGGTGIGLALVKSLVDRQGGAVEVESTVGQGTTFRVTLPAVAHRSARREQERPPEDGA